MPFFYLLKKGDEKVISFLCLKGCFGFGFDLDLDSNLMRQSKISFNSFPFFVLFLFLGIASVQKENSGDYQADTHEPEAEVHGFLQNKHSYDSL